MRYIGNIITNKSFKDKELYNIVKSQKDIIMGLPTLIIGWEEAKKLYPEANILDWKINDNTFWTFSNRERRSRYEENLKKFKDYAIRKMVKSLDYRFFNVITSTVEEKREFFDMIKSGREFSTYICNDMLYICDNENRIVHGILLTDIDYIGNDRNKIIKSLNRENIENLKGEDFITYEMKKQLANYSYAIPYIYKK